MNGGKRDRSSERIRWLESFWVREGRKRNSEKERRRGRVRERLTQKFAEAS